MATARHLHLNDNPSPNIDVYTTPVVVYAGETFNWTISGQDRQSGVAVTPITIWPFVPTSFGVSLGNGTPATVLDMPGEYQFQCTPPAPTSPQLMIVAKVYGPCADVHIPPGGYFAWQNTGNGAIVVKAPHGHTLPLVGNPTTIPIQPNTIQIEQVLPNAPIGDYPFDVTMQQGGSAVCAELTTPKIIVTAPEPGPKPKHSY